MGYDFKQIAKGARAFLDAGNTLKSNLNNGYPGTELIPAYVNTAIACELYMKAMLVYKEPNTTEQKLKSLSHNLSRLFKEIPSEIHDRIKTKIPDNEVINREESAYNSLNELLKSSNISTEVRNIANNQISNKATSFDQILENHSRIFVDWRYHFVATDLKPIYCNEWFLYTFCIELHNEMVAIMNHAYS